MLKQKKKVTNPYTRNVIPNDIINNMKLFIRLSKILGFPLEINIAPHQPIQTNGTYETRVVNVFQTIDDLGNYTNPDWFLSLTRFQKTRFIRELYDIWFASKSNNYLFNNNDNVSKTNFWNDIIEFRSNKTEKYPKELIRRIIKASSYKLSWVLDPFSRIGDIGVNAIEMGRRFIGFEANKDKILLSMKKIDRK